MDALLQEVLDGYRRFDDEVQPVDNGRSSEQPTVLLEHAPRLEELEAMDELTEIGRGIA